MGIFFRGALLVGGMLLCGCGSGGSGSDESRAGAANTAGEATGGAGAGGTSSTGGAASGGASAGSSGAAGAAVGPEAACTAHAKARCSRYQACLPMWFAILFSSAADCEQATLATCLLELNAPGTKRTAQDFAACAADSTAQSCADWQGNSPTSCVKAGTLALGAGCEFDSQCVSTFCERVEGSWCGACKALGAAGAACDPQQVSCVSGLLCAYGCASGSSCAAAEMLFRCAEPRAQGATCNSVTQCAIGLTCSGGVCSPGNLGVGDVCDPSVSRICSITDDLSCVTDAAGSTCVKNAYALADQACNTATANHCAGLGACDGADGALVPAGPGICRAPGGVGEACSSDHLCRQPALCFGGVCTAPVEANTCH